MRPLDSFYSYIRTVSAGPMCEAVSRAFAALFEGGGYAKALHMCREQLRSKGFDSEQAAKIVNDIMHCFLDVFAETPSYNCMTLPEVKEKAKYIPGFFKLGMELGATTESGLAACRHLRSRLKSYVLQNEGQLDRELNIVDEAGGIASKFKADDLWSYPEAKIDTPLLTPPAPGHEYYILHIKNYDESHPFSKYVSWCISSPNTPEYWDDYSNEGSLKCYFIIRDDYMTIDRPSVRPSNPDDEYGRTMIGIFVKPNGEIDNLFNRWNNFSHIYGETAMSQLLGKPFREACPPYTDEEAEASHAEWLEAHGGSDEPDSQRIAPGTLTFENFTDYATEAYQVNADRAYNITLDEILYEFPDTNVEQFEIYEPDDGRVELAMVSLEVGGTKKYNLIYTDNETLEVSQIGAWSEDKYGYGITMPSSEACVYYAIMPDGKCHIGDTILGHGIVPPDDYAIDPRKQLFVTNELYDDEAPVVITNRNLGGIANYLYPIAKQRRFAPLLPGSIERGGYTVVSATPVYGGGSTGMCYIVQLNGSDYFYMSTVGDTPEDSHFIKLCRISDNMKHYIPISTERTSGALANTYIFAPKDIANNEDAEVILYNERLGGMLNDRNPWYFIWSRKGTVLDNYDTMDFDVYHGESNVGYAGITLNMENGQISFNYINGGDETNPDDCRKALQNIGLNSNLLNMQKLMHTGA